MCEGGDSVVIIGWVSCPPWWVRLVSTSLTFATLYLGSKVFGHRLTHLFSCWQPFATPKVLFSSIGLRRLEQSRDIRGEPIQKRNVSYTYTGPEICTSSFTFATPRVSVGRQFLSLSRQKFYNEDGDRLWHDPERPFNSLPATERGILWGNVLGKGNYASNGQRKIETGGKLDGPSGGQTRRNFKQGAARVRGKCLERNNWACG